MGHDTFLLMDVTRCLPSSDSDDSSGVIWARRGGRSSSTRISAVSSAVGSAELLGGSDRSRPYTRDRTDPAVSSSELDCASFPAEWGCLTYVAFLNPLTYESMAVYPYLTASLPAAAVAALVYYLGSLAVIRAGRGGYRRGYLAAGVASIPESKL